MNDVVVSLQRRCEESSSDLIYDIIDSVAHRQLFVLYRSRRLLDVDSRGESRRTVYPAIIEEQRENVSDRSRRKGTTDLFEFHLLSITRYVSTRSTKIH